MVYSAPSALGADVVLRLGADGGQLVLGIAQAVAVHGGQRSTHDKGAGAGQARALGWRRTRGVSSGGHSAQTPLPVADARVGHCHRPCSAVPRAFRPWRVREAPVCEGGSGGESGRRPNCSRGCRAVLRLRARTHAVACQKVVDPVVLGVVNLDGPGRHGPGIERREGETTRDSSGREE